MKFPKRAYYRACSLIPTRMLTKIFQFPTLFPYHHLVSNEDVLHIKHLYTYKNIRQFTDDLDYLLKYFRPVSVQDIVESVEVEKKMPSNGFLLSFDDGFREIYD